MLDPWWLVPVFIPLTLLAALLPLMLHFSNTLVKPRRLPRRLTPSDLGLTDWQEVSFRSADGLTLRGWFVPPLASARGATVLFVHGTGSSRERLLLQAATLHRAGFGALLFDLRGHGSSEGRLSSFGFHEAGDVEAALAYLRSRSDVHPERIAALGHSMGGAAVLLAAARRDEAMPLVIVAAISSLNENLRHGLRHFTRLPVQWLMPPIVRLSEVRVGVRVSQIQPGEAIRQLGHCPLFLVYGDQDRLVPLENGQRLRAQAGRLDVPLIVVRGAGHRSVLSEAYFAQYEAALLEFLRSHLLSPGAQEPKPSDSSAPPHPIKAPLPQAERGGEHLGDAVA